MRSRFRPVERTERLMRHRTVVPQYARRHTLSACRHVFDLERQCPNLGSMCTSSRQDFNMCGRGERRDCQGSARPPRRGAVVNSQAADTAPAPPAASSRRDRGTPGRPAGLANRSFAAIARLA